ncbi:MAG: DNA primase [Dysgonamonadaceae bacterium]|jgi:DNA primase|nr:DNA primase [Dysgonamonadaceae bacterium]
MIDYATVERIQSAAQIYDVVSDFVTLRKRGVNYVGLCPFHEERTPSFSVSPSKNICKCFSCGEGGSPIHFVMKHEQLSYVEALKFLAKKYNIEVKETELTDEQKQMQGDRESMFILNAFAQKTFTDNLFETEEGQTIGLSYFRERGFREDVIRKFQLGYSPEKWDAFTQKALAAGYKKEYLEKTGLTIIRENNRFSDRFHGRVMFPVHSLSGKIVAFGGRILKKHEKTAKYLNSPESEIYHKSNELYGIYLARQAIVKQDRCFLVEGYTDVISMHQAGIENVVASSGTALTQGQIRLIHRFTSNVTVLYDGDKAGIKAAIRGIDLLLEAGLNIKIVLLPEGEDPDSFAQKQNATAFNEYITQNETDFVHFKTALLIKDAENDPVKKAKMISEIVDTVALIPEEIIRLIYVKECARLVEMDEQVLVKTIAKKRRELLLQKKKTLYPDPENPEDAIQSHQRPPEEETPSEPGIVPATEISLLEEYEKDILYYVVRYGEQTFLCEENGKEIYLKVIDYMVTELNNTGLEFTNPLYRQMLQDAHAHCGAENFVAETYFINHPDPQISRMAFELSTNKYIESKIHFKYREKVEEDKKLLLLAPYAFMNYRNAVLKKEMDDLNRKIKDAEANNDFESLNELVKQLLKYQEERKIIAFNLRERIISK